MNENTSGTVGVGAANPSVRPTPASRLAPLTGVVQTDGHGLLVRRVRVRVTAGPDRGREAMLEAGTLLVGTHGENDLILRDPAVAKYHLELSLVASGVRVRDLGGDGGTLVNGLRVNQSTVPTTTEIVLGKSTLALVPADQMVPIALSDRSSFGPVLGRAPALRQLYALLERLAPSDVPLLIEGEPGAGRTLVAKAVHAASRFAATPILSVDLSARSSERPPLRQLSHRSDTFTLLLERIDEAPASLWPELLSVYERREEGVLDARIIATASPGLGVRPNDPRVRRDLLAHVTSVRLVVPPLRERLDDVPLLLRQFAREACGVEPPFEPGDFARALSRPYPGNVRELRQLVVRALAEERSARAQLPAAGLARARAALVLPLNARPKPPDPAAARERICDMLLRDDVERARVAHGDNHEAVAHDVGVPHAELLGHLRRWGLIEAPRVETAPPTDAGALRANPADAATPAVRPSSKAKGAVKSEAPSSPGPTATPKVKKVLVAANAPAPSSSTRTPIAPRVSAAERERPSPAAVPKKSPTRAKSSARRAPK